MSSKSAEEAKVTALDQSKQPDKAADTPTKENEQGGKSGKPSAESKAQTDSKEEAKETPTSVECKCECQGKRPQNAIACSKECEPAAKKAKVEGQSPSPEVVEIPQKDDPTEREKLLQDIKSEKVKDYDVPKLEQVLRLHKVEYTGTTKELMLEALTKYATLQANGKEHDKPNGKATDCKVPQEKKQAHEQESEQKTATA